LRLRIYEEETGQGDGRGRDRERERERERGGTPDLLIAWHSCPFIRHLIVSRGSRRILRGGYLRSLFSSFLDPSSSFNFMERIWVSGTRFVAIDASRYVPCRISLLHVSNAADQSCLATLSFFPGFCEHSSQNVPHAPRRFTTGIALKIVPMMPIYSFCQEMRRIPHSAEMYKTMLKFILKQLLKYHENIAAFIDNKHWINRLKNFSLIYLEYPNFY